MEYSGISGTFEGVGGFLRGSKRSRIQGEFLGPQGCFLRFRGRFKGCHIVSVKFHRGTLF